VELCHQPGEVANPTRDVLLHVTTILNIQPSGRVRHQLHQAGGPFLGNGASLPARLLLDHGPNKLNRDTVVPGVDSYVIFGFLPGLVPGSSPTQATGNQKQK
jgi:hypothetical protein